MLSVVVPSMAGVLVAMAEVLAVVVILKLLLPNPWATVRRLVLEVSGVVGSEVASTEEGLEEAAAGLVVVASAVVDALEIAATALLTELLQVHDLAAGTVEETVALTTEALAMLTSSPYLLVEVTAEVIVADSATVTATVTVDTLGKRGLTTAVGMMSRGQDAGIERAFLRLPDGDHRMTSTSVHGQHLENARWPNVWCTFSRSFEECNTNGESDYLLWVSTGSHRHLRQVTMTSIGRLQARN